MKLKPLPGRMDDVLLKLYRTHGILRVKSLRRLGVSTVKALERRNLIHVEYDKEHKYWVIRITSKGEKVAKRLMRG